MIVGAKDLIQAIWMKDFFWNIFKLTPEGLSQKESTWFLLYQQLQATEYLGFCAR